MYTVQEKGFSLEFLDKVKQKISFMAPIIGANFPNTNSATGIWDPTGKNANISSWTTAFWPGIMWLMYLDTNSQVYREIAEKCEEKLDEALSTFSRLHHDVGFMWSLSAIADYKLTGNNRSKERAMHAATILAGRFNHVAKYIRAWNGNVVGTAIIDSMMNLPILYWASEESGDPRFRQIAIEHANTVMNTFIRPDGSVNHMVDFDPESGEVLATPFGQGYESGSSWSRGQAWAIYGFVLSYLNTKEEKFLNVAKSVAHYFIANLEDERLPRIDFRAPEEPQYYDASAAAIAACGLIEIANCVGEYEKKIYERAAIKLLHVLDADCDYSEQSLNLLCTSSASYHREKGRHLPWIFGDYYLLEALMKLKGNDGRFTVHK